MKYILFLIVTIVIIPSYFTEAATSTKQKSVATLTRENTALREKVAMLEKNIKRLEGNQCSNNIATTSSNNQVSVSIKTVNTFNDTLGYQQKPQSIAYKFDNKTEKDVYITALDLGFKTTGEFGLGFEKAWYTVSESFRSKEDYRYIPSNGSLANYQFDKAVKIPASGAITLYVNSWGYSGPRFGASNSSVITTLNKVYSNNQGVVFDFGGSSQLTWEDKHNTRE